jgi:hypothetical protein
MVRYTREDLRVINMAKLYFMHHKLSEESYKLFINHMRSKLEDYRK